MSAPDVFPTTEASSLAYYGLPMDPRPVVGTLQRRVSVEALVGVLEAAREGAPLTVAIEPGDATRYAFAVSLHWVPGPGEVLRLTRLQGGSLQGDPLGTVDLPRGGRPVHWTDVWTLANGNHWSARLLAWWAATLLHALSLPAPRSTPWPPTPTEAAE
jgi:hypothetical protein